MLTLLTAIVALNAAAPAPVAHLDLRVEVDGAPAVAGARYSVAQVPCAGASGARRAGLTVERDIHETAAFGVEAGCYEVRFAPLDARGQVLSQCEPGVAIAPVDAAAPTRVVFVTSCAGLPEGR